MTPELKLHLGGAVWAMVWIWTGIFVYMGTKSVTWMVVPLAFAVIGPLFALIKILGRRSAATRSDQDIVQ